MLIGAHESATGGIDKVFQRAIDDECESFQVFVKAPSRWTAKDFAAEEIASFRESLEKFGRLNVTAHAAYLINLASLDDEIVRKSLLCLTEELSKCSSINIPYYVMHPGSKGEGDHENALALIASRIDKIYNENDVSTMLLIENTAGTGNHTGGELTDLQKIIDRAKSKDKIGVCIDTCHSFVYGYDLKNDYELFAEKVFSLFGDKVKVFHLNDTKKELGSKSDRHEFIGKGFLGEEVFKTIVNDKRFKNALGILETPVKDKATYLDEIRLLKSFRKP